LADLRERIATIGHNAETQEVSGNMHSAAAAAEQLTASIRGISTSASEATTSSSDRGVAENVR
jgi:methyl-accepting chemotaxis protein